MILADTPFLPFHALFIGSALAVAAIALFSFAFWLRK